MQKRSFAAHDGSFHADEVTACSLLLVFDRIDRDKIYRTRDPSLLARCEYVCDVGGVYDPASRRFDHHQAEYRGNLSSAGMVLLYLQKEGILAQDEYQMLQNSLILGVDAHDNGIVTSQEGTATFSHVISSFLPIDYESSAEEMTAAFFEAVDFVTSFLRRLLARFAYTKECRTLVEHAMETKKPYLFFVKSLPWIDNFFALGGKTHPAQFVIMPSGPHWKLRGIPPSLEERMDVRKPLPKAWGGLQGKELESVSGIAGAVFCHKGLFISIWETKEAAIEAVAKGLSGNNF